jgi:hypothetical protein
MNRFGGWNIWAKDGDQFRLFTVPVLHPDAALTALMEAHPNLQVISKHVAQADLINMLRIPDGHIMEWKPEASKGERNEAGVD